MEWDEELGGAQRYLRVEIRCNTLNTIEFLVKSGQQGIQVVVEFKQDKDVE